MKISYIFFMLCLALLACKNEKAELTSKIQSLETQARQTQNLNTIDTLLNAYQNYISTFPDDKTLITAFQNTAKDLITKRLATLRTQIFDETTGVLNPQYADEFILLSERYSKILPDDKQTPDVLFQAGEMAGAVHRNEQALAFYESINTKYTEYAKSAQVLFMRAFILDSELREFDKAKILYQEFINKYPKDDFADDAKFLLENLGKSEEELIRSFQQKQNQSI